MPNRETMPTSTAASGTLVTLPRPVADTLGITVFGCDAAEAEVFAALAPRVGVLPTLTSASPTPATAREAQGTRCVSVAHTSLLCEPTLRALRRAGVEYVSTRSIGFDHIDLGAAAALGITVENTVYDPDGVADFTVMLMLMALRDAAALVGTSEGRRVALRGGHGRELRDMTVGVVGVGRIGNAVVERLQGFGCRVLTHGSRRRREPPTEEVALAELLRSSDVVTLHLPLTESTFHLLGAEQIASMKARAVLVNTARGGLVDTRALIAALERGHLGAAALDVVEGEERHAPGCAERTVGDDVLARLHELSNVLLTPHAAYRTTRALHDVVEATIAGCVRFARTRTDG